MHFLDKSWSKSVGKLKEVAVLPEGRGMGVSEAEPLVLPEGGGMGERSSPTRGISSGSSPHI
jgi:hypothetical protein